MSQVINFIKLDFNRSNNVTIPTIEWDQGSRFVRVQLQNNNQSVDVTGSQVVITVIRNDLEEVIESCNILNAKEGLIEFEISKSMVARQGDMLCQLKLSDNDSVLSSQLFKISVNNTLMVSLEESRSEMDALIHALGEVQNIDNRFAQTNAQLSQKAGKNETKNIQQQINNLVISSGGDGNPEVIQARGEYAVLNDRLNHDLFSAWIEIFPTWKDGIFINGSDGSGVELNGYSSSNPITVGDYNKIRIKKVKGNDVISVITFYSTDSSQLLSTKIVDVDTDVIEVDVPNNAVSFRLCKQTTNDGFSAYIHRESRKEKSENVSDCVVWHKGFYIDNNGVPKINESFMYSDFLRVSAGIEIKKMCKINFPNVAFYDKTGSFIKSVNNVDRYVITDNDVAGNIYYFRVCTGIAHGTPIINVSPKNLFTYTLKEDDEDVLLDVSDDISYLSGFIELNGQIKTPFSGFQVSSIFRVVTGINIFDIVANTQFYNIAFYDKDMVFITGIKNIEKITLSDSNIPENAYYFRVATRTTKSLRVELPLQYFYEDIGVFINQDLTDKSIVLPKYIDAVVGNETTFYLDNLLLSEYATVNTQLKHKVVDKGVQFTPDAEETKILSVYERDNKFNVLLEKSTNIRCVAKNGDGSVKNILLIGDSLIDNNYVAKELYRMLDDDGDYVINQLGTRGPSGGKHEGHGGWSWEDYFKETYDGKPNAFYNNGGLDFKNYCNVNGYSGIDFCIIALGTNDVRQGGTSPELFTDAYINSIIEHAKTFIDILTKDYPSCKIAIGLPSIGGDGLITSNPNAFHYKMKKLNKAYIDTFDDGIYNPNVTTVAHGLFINTRLGYSYEELPVSKRFASEVVKVYSENIHSNASGYYCYADGFYGKIRSWLSGNL